MRIVAALVLTVVVAGGCASAPPSRASSAARGSTSMQHTLIPRPAVFEPRSGDGFVVTPTTVIHVPAGSEELLRIGRLLSDWIGIAAGPAPPRVDSGGTPPAPGAVVRPRGEDSATRG